MRNIFFLVAACLCCSLAYAQPGTPQLEKYLLAAEKAGWLNGAVLVSLKGQTLVNKGYGYKDASSKSRNTDQTIFQVGSVTKQFTATIILKLAEQNRLQLSENISKYFPGFPNGEKITIEHLLTHTSGIYNYTQLSDFMKISDQPADQDRMISLFRDKPLDFEPGSKFNYSNSGYMLLGYIAEKVAGRPYYQLVREWIFRPLGMTHSGFDFTHLSDPNKAVGYYTMADTTFSKAKIVDSSVSFAAGALYSTTGDLYKWDRALMKGALLKKASFDNAYTPRLRKYGFGIVIDSLNSKRRLAHAGGIDGFGSMNTVIPEDSLVIVVLNNLGSAKATVVASDIQSIIYNLPYTLPGTVRQEIKVDEAILKQYVGNYDLAPGVNVEVRLENGALISQITGQQPVNLYAEKENFFFLKVVDAQVEFLKNADGKVDRLLIYQNGSQASAKRKAGE